MLTAVSKNGASAVRTAARRKPLSPKAVLSHLILILSSVGFVFPFYWMIVTSLKAPDEIFSWPPIFVPQTWQWGNYAEVANAIPIVRMFFNSLFVSVTVTLGTVFFCALAAYAFGRIRFPGREAIFRMYLATMMVPGMVTMIPMFIIMRDFGWIDTYWALIVPGFFGNAFGTFLLRQFFMTLPVQLDEAARIDGASYFGIFFRILLPLVKPALASLFIFTFMGVWNDFLWPLIMIQSDDLQTLSLGLSSFQGMYAARYNLLMAGAVLSVVPVLIAYVFGQRYFIEGITLTGLKG
ncbi:carbohydrate ABC transporter permease [Paenibacillus sp.]|uniref:carbohydrate ABC transporter permease n=1 Tax=Paenibacillus sp. TaxID=58172 RepID=UPI002D3922B7|nr:carbohydrate ABC transporter permease [Paenibacillus sp.]HZG58522.1 carbohydrate ABC transporter permease [Paenibacillus sp.]